MTAAGATTTRRVAIGACLLGALAALQPAAAAQPAAGLTAAPEIARAYDAIFDARFDDVPALLRQTCPPAAPEVCLLLDAVARWWRIQLDADSTAWDDAFVAGIDTAVASIESWTGRAPAEAEAWFYLGGAYGARAQWRALRGDRLAAARDGKRIKDSLERALDLDGTLQDAYFGIGLYHYYADVAPAGLRMLRWLLLLPGGDKAEGLREMMRARDSGQLLRSEADYQLHLLDLWYERQPLRALDLLRDLQVRHSSNPHFLQRIAEVHDVYLSDAPASLRAWEELLAAARARRVRLPEMAEAAARLGIATQLDRLNQTAAALPHLRAVIAAAPAAPYGAVARAHLQLGEALDRLGARADAVIAYRAALAALPEDDRQDVGDRARQGIRTPRR